MKPVMNKKPIVLGVLLGLLVWALLIGGVAAVLAQDDADPFATVTPESTNEIVVIVPESSVDIETPVDDSTGRVSEDAFNALLLTLTSVVSVVVVALSIVTGKSIHDLGRSVPVQYLIQIGANTARLTTTPKDDERIAELAAQLGLILEHTESGWVLVKPSVG